MAEKLESVIRFRWFIIYLEHHCIIASGKYVTDFAGVHNFLFASVSYLVHIPPSVRLLLTSSCWHYLVKLHSFCSSCQSLCCLILYGFCFNLKVLSSLVFLSVFLPCFVPVSSLSWLLMWLTCTLFPSVFKPTLPRVPFQIVFVFWCLSSLVLPLVWLPCMTGLLFVFGFFPAPCLFACLRLLAFFCMTSCFQSH